MNDLAPWVFECSGKPRPGDSPGMGGLHVWRMNPDGVTATCQKCRVTLTPEETADCYRDH